MFVSATWAQVKPLPTPQARKRMVQAVDKTLQEGPHAKLPPHLSTLLGLSQEQECPVRKGVVRTGKVVQGFEDRKSTRLNSSHVSISYAVFCLKKKKQNYNKL